MNSMRSHHLLSAKRRRTRQIVYGLDRFVKEVKLTECGLSYAVVVIMGPQSSGKSTLLNHLFWTKFREMDAYGGRSQTTKGIWIARCVGIELCTIAMDLEGTDGRERGEVVRLIFFRGFVGFFFRDFSVKALLLYEFFLFWVLIVWL
ncbi:hypothetical protein ACFX13_004411 [Malus domestica]